MSVPQVTNHSDNIPTLKAVIVPKVITKVDCETKNETVHDQADSRLAGSEADACDEFCGQTSAIISGIGKPYEPLNEQGPRLPAYHLSFIEVENLCTGLIYDAKALL